MITLRCTECRQNERNKRSAGVSRYLTKKQNTLTKNGTLKTLSLLQQTLSIK
jgi:hypothetical protein